MNRPNVASLRFKKDIPNALYLEYPVWLKNNFYAFWVFKRIRKDYFVYDHELSIITTRDHWKVVRHYYERHRKR